MQFNLQFDTLKKKDKIKHFSSIYANKKHFDIIKEHVEE